MAPYRIYPQVREIRMGPWICGRQKKGVGLGRRHNLVAFSTIVTRPQTVTIGVQ